MADNTTKFFFKNKPNIVWEAARQACIKATQELCPNPPIVRMSSTPICDYPIYHTIAISPDKEIFIEFLKEIGIGKFKQSLDLMYVINFGEIVSNEHELFGKANRAEITAGLDAAKSELAKYGLLPEWYLQK